MVAGCAEGEGPSAKPEAAAVLFKLELWGTFETTGGEHERRMLEERQIMKSGATVSMSLQKPDEGRVYLVSLDSKGDLAVLYPAKEQMGQAAETIRLLDHVHLDDHTGLERIYMIASVEPLAALDKAIAALHDDPAASDAVLEAVQTLRDEYEAIESEPPRPSPIGGQARGETLSLEYSVRGVRCRTFTIDHR